MATGILPREFAFKQRGQIPVAIVRFLLRKKNTHTHTHTVVRFTVVWSWGAFAIVYSS